MFRRQSLTTILLVVLVVLPNYPPSVNGSVGKSISQTLKLAKDGIQSINLGSIWGGVQSAAGFYLFGMLVEKFLEERPTELPVQKTKPNPIPPTELERESDRKTTQKSHAETENLEDYITKKLVANLDADMQNINRRMDNLETQIRKEFEHAHKRFDNLEGVCKQSSLEMKMVELSLEQVKNSLQDLEKHFEKDEQNVVMQYIQQTKQAYGGIKTAYQFYQDVRTYCPPKFV